MKFKQYIVLVLGIVTFLTGLVLKFALNISYGSKVMWWGIWATFIGTIAFRAMKQADKEKEDDTFSPQKSEDEIQKEKVENVVYQKKDEIPFLIVRAFLSLLALLGGISILLTPQGNKVVGIALLLLAILLLAVHIFFIIQNIKLINIAKNAENQDGK